MFWCNVAVET